MSADGIGIKEAERESLSPFWRYGVLIVFIIGFGVLIWITAGAYRLGPPIPDLSSAPTDRRFSRVMTFDPDRKSS